MHRASTPLALALCAAATFLGGAPLSARAQAAAEKTAGAGPRAASACERAVQESLTARAIKTAEVSFSAAPSEQADLSNESQTVLRGTGRLKGAAGTRSFAYTCNVDRSSFEVVGLVMRDSTPAATAAPAPAPNEPNLSALSPAACESSAALLLQQRWPGVSKISFDSATRRFQQSSAVRAELLGSGRAEPTPGAAPRLFGFECAIDPRDGRVLKISLSG